MHPRPTALITALALAGAVATLPMRVAAQDGPADLRLLLQIGELDGPIHYTFGRPGSVRLLPGERLLVMDGMAVRAHVYDMGGRHLYSFGQRGAGPGELQAPSGVTVTGEAIHVFDSELQRLTAFSFEGDVLGTWRVPDPVGRVANPVMRLRGGRWFAEGPGSLSTVHIRAVVAGEPRAGGSGIGRFLLFDDVSVDTLMSFQVGGVFWYDAVNGLPFGGAPPGDFHFGPGGRAAVAGDSLVAFVDTHRGRITWLRATEGGVLPAETVDLAMPPLPVTAGDLSEVERGLRAGRTSLPSRLGLLAPDHRAHFTAALLDDGGNVWLRRAGDAADAGDPRVFLVVSPGGERREVTLPPGFTLSAVQGTLLLGTNRTDLDVPIVQVYETAPAPGMAGGGL